MKTKSPTAILQKYHQRFGNDHTPNRRTILKLYAKFKKEGTILNLNKGRSGRLRHARSPQNIQAVRRSVLRSPEKSYRVKCQEMGIAKESFRRILRLDLKLYPYRISVRHKLTPRDKRQRVDMCRWFSAKIEENAQFLDNVWFSDETHFFLSGHVNSHNSVYWGTKPPEKVLEKPLHSSKVTAWLAVNRIHGTIGPFWFMEDDETATVNSERYVAVLQKFRRHLRHTVGALAMPQQWFQQDGASPHTANISLNWLRDKFGPNLIAKKCENEWSPHSPDLSPLDYWFWGFAKDKVYAGRPQTLQELRNAIEDFTNSITIEAVAKAVDNLIRRIDVCVRQRGGHLEHIIHHSHRRR